MTWIQTFTGGQFDLADPQRGSIDVVDMAHALSLLCRFNGHVRQHYSVAQHCVIVSHLVPSEHAYAGLLHDATEAYVGDVSKPLKMLLPDYQRVEQRVWEAVAAWAGLPTVLPKTVKHADMVALFWEWRDLLATPPTEWMDERYAVHVPALGLVPMSAEEAELAWLARYAELAPHTVQA